MRIDSPRSKRIVLATLCWGACWGCGVAGGGPQAALIPVKGRVTYKGQPVSKGRIKFAPDGFGRPAYGRLRTDGTYELMTQKEGDGVVAGSHRVTVADTGIMSPKNALATKWANTAASGLTAEVDTEHTEFNFELK